MKNVKPFVFLFIAFLMSMQFAHAQVRKIPAPVTDAFKAKYANATGVEWKDRLTSYSAIFQLDGKKHQAYFDDDGTWKQTDTEIAESELPAAVNNGFQKSKYAEWSLERAEKVEKNDGTIEYRVQVRKGDIRKKNLLFTPEGRMKKDKVTL